MKRRTMVVCLVLSVFLCIGLVSVGLAATKEEPKKEPAKLVDLNTASQADLESLKGVGPATAKKIIANRPYKTVDDLSKAGLSKKQIESLRTSVTVGAAPAATAPKEEPKAAPAPAKAPEKAAAPAKAEKPKEGAAKKEAAPKLAPGQKININTATKADLEKLPEIGPVKAQAIIDGRPYSKPEDIMKVKGIKQKTFDKIKDNITVN